MKTSSYTIKDYSRGVLYSLPVQLLFLHFRKYQVLLIFWLLLFSVVNGGFMKSFGAEALFLAPEYLGNVNAIGAAIMGAATGVFIMCWNITTFILFSRHFTFLAATRFPFLKYCINNSAIPLFFLIFYLIKACGYMHYRELIPTVEIIFLILGFLVGLVLILSISFFYFFQADKTILKKLQPLFNSARHIIAHLQPPHATRSNRSLIYSEWFLDSFAHVRRCRDVSHYSDDLMETIFKRHHFAAVVSLLISYLFLVLIGYFVDSPFFQMPAGASITLFCAILTGVIGALVYFFQSWSVPALIAFLLLLNTLYEKEWIDPRNKAYGLNYTSRNDYPVYTKESLERTANMAAQQADKHNMEAILNRWKAKQKEQKPPLVIIATSGGGLRSATFTMKVLQHLDSISGGEMMNKTFLITGASGGMIGASYFRELYRQRLKQPQLDIRSGRYLNNIAEDLLNPTFTSFIARDLFAPERKFTMGKYTYQRDRGYAFEQSLSNNTEGVLNKQLKDYVVDEREARIPLMFYHNVIARDAKMLYISTQPLRFMMQPPADSVHGIPSPDAVDFISFFSKQDPQNLRLLTALRMNATFPVVLPNVWLPAKPVLDVMDGGLRDNYGISTALRFATHMKDWIEANTSGLVMVQIRDRTDGGWEHPYEFGNLTGNTIKPFFLLQNNWYKMQEYFQGDMTSYFITNSGYPIQSLSFQYIPKKEEDKAALSFHLTQREKLDIESSILSKHNEEGFKKLLQVISTEVGKELPEHSLSWQTKDKTSGSNPAKPVSQKHQP